jgi:hypothetical protein
MRDIMIIFEVPHFSDFTKCFNKIFFDKTDEEIDKEVKDLRDAYVCEVAQCLCEGDPDFQYFDMVNVNADWFDVTDIKKVIDVIASLPV